MKQQWNQMIKSELTRRIAAKMTRLPEQTIAEGVDGLLCLMSNALATGQHIEIRGFSSFVTRTAKPRNARNPKTGERMVTAATPKAHFKPGIVLKKRLMTTHELIAIEPIKGKHPTEQEDEDE